MINTSVEQLKESYICIDSSNQTEETRKEVERRLFLNSHSIREITKKVEDAKQEEEDKWLEESIFSRNQDLDSDDNSIIIID